MMDLKILLNTLLSSSKTTCKRAPNFSSELLADLLMALTLLELDWSAQGIPRGCGSQDRGELLGTKDINRRSDWPRANPVPPVPFSLPLFKSPGQFDPSTSLGPRFITTGPGFHRTQLRKPRGAHHSVTFSSKLSTSCQFSSDGHRVGETWSLSIVPETAV